MAQKKKKNVGLQAQKNARKGAKAVKGGKGAKSAKGGKGAKAAATGRTRQSFDLTPENIKIIKAAAGGDAAKYARAVKKAGTNYGISLRQGQYIAKTYTLKAGTTATGS